MAQIGYGKGSSTILPDPPGITPDEFGFTTLAANTWYHIALTLERKTAGGTSYYVTGNLYTNGAEGPTVYDTGSSRSSAVSLLRPPDGRMHRRVEQW